MTNPRLIIGGPFNGERRHWSGDIVTYPNDVEYRLKKIKLGDSSMEFYIYKDLTDEAALILLKDNYLGIA